jgi:hypothetical protein
VRAVHNTCLKQEQVASENNSIDAMLSGRAHEPFMERMFPVQIG